jgi:hypothetical protein
MDAQFCKVVRQHVITCHASISCYMNYKLKDLRFRVLTAASITVPPVPGPGSN